jgi:DNA-binding transcriptional regulator WhiA
MTTDIRIVQFFKLTDSDGDVHRYQNYFVYSNKTFASENYAFAPFQVSGSVSSLNGDNYQVQVLFPATEYAIKLVEKGNGNRKSILCPQDFLPHPELKLAVW